MVPTVDLYGVAVNRALYNHFPGASTTNVEVAEPEGQWGIPDAQNQIQVDRLKGLIAATAIIDTFGSSADPQYPSWPVRLHSRFTVVLDAMLCLTGSLHNLCRPIELPHTISCFVRSREHAIGWVAPI